MKAEDRREEKRPRGPAPFRRLREEMKVQSPFVDTSAFWRSMAHGATISMFVMVFGVLLFFSRPLLLPILAALVIGMTVGPIAAWAGRRGLPSWASALAAVVVVIAGIYVAAIFLSAPVTDMVSRSSEIGQAIKDKLTVFAGPLAALHELRASVPNSGQQTVVIASDPTDMLGNVVSVVTPAVVQFLLFFGTLFFFILGRNGFRNQIISLFPTREGRLRALKTINDIEQNLSGYLLTVTFINFGTGLVIALGTWAIGLPTPLVWGAMAFALNYIPYIGPAILHGILFIIGLLTFPTLTGALIPPAFSMMVFLVEGQFLTPNIIGRKLELNPLTVFLAVAFWTWLWGPLGAFLAMPLLIVGLVTFKHLYPATKSAIPG